MSAISRPTPRRRRSTCRAAEARRGDFGERTVWLAASTHPGEDEMVAEAHRIMKRNFPISSPSSCRAIPSAGRRSPSSSGTPSSRARFAPRASCRSAATDIYVADTIGELGLFYALAPVAFVGGSLVPHGGQNPVEPIKLGAAVLTGPNWQNFTDAYERAAAGRRRQARSTDAASLAQAALDSASAIAAAREVMSERAERRRSPA